MSPLPTAARVIGQAVTGTIEAATAQDAARFAEESEQLAALDPERVRLVMGGLLSSLLEARMPDGLSGDDLRDVLETGVRRTAPWFPAVDTAAFVLVLTDALGVQREDEPIDLGHTIVVQHGALLISGLLVTSDELPAHLAHAFAEIERDQTVELP